MITIEDSLAKLKNKLNHIVIDAYAPKSTRWHRNYNDIAWWHYVWQMNNGELP